MSNDTTLNMGTTDAETLLNAGMAMALRVNHTNDGHEFVVLPAGAKLQSVENMQKAPARARGTVPVRGRCRRLHRFGR